MNIDEMTPEELNLAIARIKMGVPELSYTYRDYAGDWAAAGELFDELLDWLDKEPVTISIVTEADGVRLRLYRNKGEDIAISLKASTRKEVISRAWLAWKSYGVAKGAK